MRGALAGWGISGAALGDFIDNRQLVTPTGNEATTGWLRKRCYLNAVVLELRAVGKQAKWGRTGVGRAALVGAGDGAVCAQHCDVVAGFDETGYL